MVDLSSAALLLAFVNSYTGPISDAPTTYHVFYHLAGHQQEPPVKDIYITVKATRLKHAASETDSGTKKSAEDIKKFGGGGGDIKNATKTEAGVAADSNGQIHVRGEHTDITYVIDGTPLPDTLSGRQGSVVVPATVQNLDIILGGFAPEYGIQTAAVLDITTLGRPAKESSDFTVGYGDHGVRNLQLTSLAPVNSRLSYVINLAHDETNIASEAQQPDNQEAHNHGEDENFYSKFIYQSSPRDRMSLTLAANPSAMQIGNRTGLSNQYYNVGQGYGFLGNRNADGTVAGGPTGALGSSTLKLGSQEDEGMDINDREVNNYALLDWRHTFDSHSSGLVSLTMLHAGQDITNDNSPVNVTNLPVDDSIEFNPTSSRNVHHAQVNANYSTHQGNHNLKVGLIYDKQSGQESYNIIPHSQLALDGLYASAPVLAPAGHLTGATDVYGNPVYVATSTVSPTLYISREGYYAGAYIQDTWKTSPRLTINYGLRADHYNQSQNLSSTPVDLALISPRLNLSYTLDKTSVLRGSYDKLFNTPPLANGAILGEALQPEVIDQYDLGLEKQISDLQTFKLAYYAKQITNQVDVGLLLPGSEIGLYTGVNFQRSGIHGIEASYEFNAPKDIGWEGYVNYTYSQASPNGLDNTGAPAPDYNDHDQRQMVSAGLSYTAPSGASAALTVTHGSGLDSSVVPPSNDRTPRTEMAMHLDTGDRLFQGRGGLSMDITNLLDDRTVINFQSGFSGTRFQTGRMISLTAHYKF